MVPHLFSGEMPSVAVSRGRWLFFLRSPLRNDHSLDAAVVDFKRQGQRKGISTFESLAVRERAGLFVELTRHTVRAFYPVNIPGKDMGVPRAGPELTKMKSDYSLPPTEQQAQLCSARTNMLLAG